MNNRGAMDLLLARVNNNTINLVGKFHSNSMLCYLHTSTHTFTAGILVRMVQPKDYELIPIIHWG